jgi:energy-coupling factor transporter transmembrane protein EcfT
MLQIILGALILAVGVFVAIKIIGNFFKVVLVLVLITLGMFLIFGYVPFADKINLKSMFGLSIDGVGRDKDGYLLVFVKNKWFFEAKNITAEVDGNQTKVLNIIENIKGRGNSILQLEWNKDFTKVKISSNIGSAQYIKK